MFYIPIWYQNQFGLDWLTAARPLEQGYLGLIVRFIYKTSHAIGLFLLVFILVTFILRKIKIENFLCNKSIFYLILSNLILFLYIPAELGYLQIFIISLYYILIKYSEKKIILAIIIINLSAWFINFDVIKIEHKYQNKCSSVQAVGASFNIQFKKGALNKFIDTRKMIECWVSDKDSEYGKKILAGKPLK